MKKHPLNLIFKKQLELDTHIHKNHNITYQDVETERVIALAVELGELANEVRCFKFWSLKKPSAKEIILEEYVDGIHFITSLAITFRMKPQQILIVPVKKNLHKKFLSGHFHYLFSSLQELDTADGIGSWYTSYLMLGQELGFSLSEIEKAYLKKCKINHQRQDNKY